MVNQQNLLKQLVQTFVPLRSIQVTHLGELIQHLHLAIQTHHGKIIKGGGSQNNIIMISLLHPLILEGEQASINDDIRHDITQQQCNQSLKKHRS